MLSEHEKQLRKQGITSSDPAAIAGFSPFRSVISVYLHKTDPDYEEETSEQMQIGDALEDVVCNLYARRSGAKLERRTTMVHPDRRLMIATPDRLAHVEGETLLVEAKTAAAWGAREDFGAEGSPEIPPHYFAQVQHACQVVGVKKWVMPVLFGGRAPIVIFQGVMEQAYCKAQWEMEMDFWMSHVEKRVIPQPDGHDSYTEYLKTAYAKAQNETLVQAGLEEERWMEVYAEARDKTKYWDDIKSEASQYIKAAIGAASGISGSWGKATWLNNKDGIQTDWEAACREAGVPEALILKHTCAKPGPRVLRVNKAKAAKAAA